MRATETSREHVTRTSRTLLRDFEARRQTSAIILSPLVLSSRDRAGTARSRTTTRPSSSSPRRSRPRATSPSSSGRTTSATARPTASSRTASKSGGRERALPLLRVWVCPPHRTRAPLQLLRLCGCALAAKGNRGARRVLFLVSVVFAGRACPETAAVRCLRWSFSDARLMTSNPPSSPPADDAIPHSPPAKRRKYERFK
jgi:hypothetical protein